MTKSIGGYFSLDLPEMQKHYHDDAVRLCSVRNCLAYVLRAKHYKKVYLPYYTCEVMLQPLQGVVEYEFYSINELLEPERDFYLSPDELFIYTNYFGLKDDAVARMAAIYGKQLFIDNAQAFFSAPISGIDTAYSARKFIGVSDGGYLYTDNKLEDKLPQDISYTRMTHLLKRIDISAESAYIDFGVDETSIPDVHIKAMSNLTSRILQSVDYDTIRKKRKNNYALLHDALHSQNRLTLAELGVETTPMIYPLWTDNGSALRQQLIQQKIYAATYWPNVFQWCQTNQLEYNLASNIVAIPIDQRYDADDMQQIIKLINS